MRERIHQRFVCDLAVTITHGERELHVQANDISLGGLSCVLEESLPYNHDVNVRFRLPAMNRDTECTMRVRWQREGRVGLQFGSLRALEVWALHQLLKTLTPIAG